MGQDISIRAEIVIRLMSDGRVGVKAPMAEPLLCYGLLEQAKQIVAKNELMREVSAERSAIVPATFAPKKLDGPDGAPL